MVDNINNHEGMLLKGKNPLESNFMQLTKRGG